MRRLHTQLFGEVWKWAGHFRLTEKNIGVDPLQIAVQLRVLLDDARHWAEKQSYPALEAAARFHHRLVQTHCFANGNGRHGRIMTDIYLAQDLKHTPVDWAASRQAVGARRGVAQMIRWQVRIAQHHLIRLPAAQIHALHPCPA